MKNLLFSMLMTICLAVPSFAAVGTLDQNGNLWNNVTTVANVPCDASNDIYLGRMTRFVILGNYNWTSGPIPAPEMWLSVDQTNWYLGTANIGFDAAKDGKANFRGAIIDGNPSAMWMQLRMCSAVTGLTVTIIGLH